MNNIDLRITLYGKRVIGIERWIVRRSQSEHVYVEYTFNALKIGHLRIMWGAIGETITGVNDEQSKM